MTTFDPSRVFDAATQGLATDARSLDALKRTAKRDPKAALKGAAQQFEALFLQMVLKSMRDAVPKSGLLESDAEKMYTSMLDQQLSTQIARSGTGLADIIAKQLGRYVGDGTAGGATTATPPLTSSQGAAAPAPRAAIDAYSTIAATDAGTASRANTGADPGLHDDQQSFVRRMWNHARTAQEATGIPAHFVLAQAALESGWGKHEIRDSSGIPTYNLFGIKAGSGWQGRTVDVVTTEYESGTSRKVVDKFRAYNNYAEAFQDWAQLIGGNKRYSDVMESGSAGSGAGFASGLARAGYATDPDYGAKLLRVIGALGGKRTGTG
ncbi:MAG TPA: flagellar assembly peptidoglycan hydrolase FlgJ [Burkholderiaceae bacterium]|nr:flagellar assembly peptidoglycan hydrolase FlgJ [Burkholderiaceae bacterium]